MCMKQNLSFGILIAVLLLVVVPVSALAASSAGNATSALQSSSDQPFISATAVPSQVPVGEPVTISGVATGGNLTAGVQIWVFAGNYIDVSTTPVNTDGSFAKTYPTTGLPPATYYVIVQSPGKDGYLNIDMETSGKYSGQVVNAKTGALIFNFTGTGSVQDSAAAQALSDAFNLPGIDDIYTKCTFQVVPPVTTAAVSSPVATAPVTTTKKSPLTLFPLLGGMVLGVCILAWRSRL